MSSNIITNRYDKYKDSGIEWIGEIPDSWCLQRLKTVGDYRNGLTYAPEDICEENNGTLVLRSSNIKEGKISLDDNVYVSSNIPQRLKVKKGDILICSRNGSRDLIGKNALITEDINASFGAFMMIFRCNNPKYFYYILNSHIFNYYLGSFFTSTINQLTGTNFGNMRIVYCPNIKEQEAIAGYLDRKCEAINETIEKQESVIEKLKECKQSIITQAVTKGLDKSAPMKDSGIEWIGQIPQHWEIRKLKTIGDYRNGLTYSPEDICEENNGTLVLRSSNIKNGKISFNDNVYVSSNIPEILKVKKDDILICSRNGSKDLIGKNALIPEELNASFGAFTMIFRCKCPQYMYNILNSHIFSYYLGSFFTSTINQLTGKNFGNMDIVYCPDINEQNQINAYLDKKCSEIDKTIEDKEKLIEKLVEYKKSLIYECVTGKRKVLA